MHTSKKMRAHEIVRREGGFVNDPEIPVVRPIMA